MSQDARRILIIKTHAIGDLLMTTPAIRDLRAAYPHARITLLVGTWSAPAVRHNPHLDERIEVEDDVLLGRRKPWRLLGLLWKIRRRRFDKVFIFHPLSTIHLFARLAGIPVRYGLLNTQGSRHLTAGVPEDLESDTYYPINFQNVVALDGVKTGPARLEVYASAADDAEADRILRAAGIDPAGDFILVAPGGGRNSKDDVAAKRWPAASYLDVVRAVRARHPELPIVLTGAPSDRPETSVVATGAPYALDLTGKTSMTVLFSLCRKACALVCNDTALMHVAMACGTPTVAVFGPTSRARFVPPALREFSVQADIECAPCYVGGRFPGCSIGYRCMQQILPATVAERLEAVLASPRPSRVG